MSYSISETNATTFVENKIIKFPRFQRKQTWTAVDNFKLTISVFKGYPIGVVIVNSSGGQDWLLDGRQRRNALKIIKENPVELYKWSKEFAKFSYTDDDEELRNLFWSSIDNYLQNDFMNKQIDEEKTNSTPDSATQSTSDTESTFEYQKQYQSLTLLLDLIVLMHPLKANQTRFERFFKLGEIIPLSELDYVSPEKGEYIINPIKIKKMILQIYEENNQIVDVNVLLEFFVRRYRLNPKVKQQLQEYFVKESQYIGKLFSIFPNFDNVVSNSTIGMIKLVNASILDAQNIFSLVNDGGTKLTAEELLSARPYWNQEIVNPSSSLFEITKKMYSFLKIDAPQNVCRWDLCATFLNRIDKNHLIFRDDFSNEKKFTQQIALGFKIISAIYVGGINNTSVTNLEDKTKYLTQKNLDWNVDIDKLVDEINLVIEILESSNYFKHLSSWHQSIMSLTTQALTIEFLVIIYRNWIDLNKPSKSSSNAKVLIKNSIVMLDKLIFEYSNRLWTGSGDNKLATDLKDYRGRIVKVPTENWLTFLAEIKYGTLKDKPTTTDMLKSLLYHYYLLQSVQPTTIKDTTYEVDHIMARDLFETNMGDLYKYKDSLMNYALLPKAENTSKNKKRLNEITEPWLKSQIIKFADLNENDFNTYSQPKNISSLIESRFVKFKTVFETTRQDYFNSL
jgi:hypothetical protein